LVFEVPTTLLAEEHVGSKEFGRRTYKYSFEYALGPRGACHGAELPFVHGSWISRDEEAILGELIGYSDDIIPHARSLCKSMIGAWGSFIKTGNPNCSSLSVEWPQFSTGKRECMVFGSTSRFIRRQDEEEWTHRDGDESFHSLVEHRLHTKKSFGFLRLD
jgi:carboxylesterase type B